MTCSIVACCPETGRFGVAVQTGYLAVGARVPWVRVGVGALATQANANIAAGAEGLAALAAGGEPNEVLAQLLATDELSAHRQLAVVDVKGRAAAFTGDQCIGYASHAVADGVACQANLMTNDGVPASMLQAWLDSAGQPLELRLVAALQAAQEAGGDVRGQVSAALKISDNQPGASWDDLSFDLRVDAHENAVWELARLVRLRQAYRLAEDGRELTIDGELDAAEVTLRRARLLAPELAEAAFWHGVTLANIGDVDAACVAIAEAAAVHPGWRNVVGRLADTGLLRANAPALARLTAV